MNHVNVELYVIGALSPLEAAAVEEHVLECAACEAALAREAAVEMDLARIAQAPPRVVRRLPRRMLMAGAAGVSVAAAWLLFLTPGVAKEPVQASPAVQVEAGYADATRLDGG
jgi:hypothetical protein